MPSAGARRFGAGGASPGVVAALLVASVCACSKGQDATARAASDTLVVAPAAAPPSAALPSATAAPSASGTACSHAVCADNFVVDALATECVAGSPCSVTIRLAATGDFHINDEYPYKFRADDAAGVEFLGTDPAGKNSFTKTSGDWQKTEPKSGAMTVKFTVAERGAKTLGGLLKLSVCSAASCLLEQRQVTASVVAK